MEGQGMLPRLPRDVKGDRCEEWDLTRGRVILGDIVSV